MKLCILIIGLISTSYLFGQFEFEWTTQFSGEGDLKDGATDIKVDNQGKLYITGTTQTNQGYKLITIKLGETGDVIWSRSSNLSSEGSSIDIDAFGNVYVTGEESNGGIVTIKYDESGKELWTRIYSDSQSWNHNHVKMKRTDSNNLIISTVRNYWSNDQSIIFLKYDKDGNFLWDFCYGENDLNEDYMSDFIIDRIENIYATGLTNYHFDLIHQEYIGGDVLILKLDGSGNLQWVNNYGSTEDYYEWGKAICIDTSDNIYITGKQINNVNTNVLTMSYDSSGKQKWIQLFEQSDTTKDEGWNIVYGENQRIYVIGFTTYLPDRANFLNITYDYLGNLLWSRNFFASEYESATVPSAIVVDPDGNVYGCGFSHDIGGRHDIYVKAYDKDGNDLFVTTYNADSNSSNKVRDMVIDNNGSLYLAVDCHKDIFIYKLSKYTGFKQEQIQSEGSAKLYPNPVTHFSTLYFENIDNTEMLIDVFDITGKLYIQIISRQESLIISRENFISGLYFYRVYNKDGCNESGKFIVK